MQKPLRNLTRAEKKAYKEKKDTALGMDLEPKSHSEIKSQKIKNPLSKQLDEEARLSGSKNLQYLIPSNVSGTGRCATTA